MVNEPSVFKPLKFYCIGEFYEIPVFEIPSVNCILFCYTYTVCVQCAMICWNCCNKFILLEVDSNLDRRQFRNENGRLASSESVFIHFNLLHSERPKLNRVLAVLSAIGLGKSITFWLTYDKQKSQ